MTRFPAGTLRRGQEEKQTALKEAASSWPLTSLCVQSTSSREEKKPMSREGTALPEATQPGGAPGHQQLLSFCISRSTLRLSHASPGILGSSRSHGADSRQRRECQPSLHLDLHTC